MNQVTRFANAPLKASIVIGTDVVNPKDEKGNRDVYRFCGRSSYRK